MTATTLTRPPTEADILDAIVRATELERFGECMDAMAGLRANLDILATAAAWFLSESAVPTKEGNGVWEPRPMRRGPPHARSDAAHNPGDSGGKPRSGARRMGRNG